MFRTINGPIRTFSSGGRLPDGSADAQPARRRRSDRPTGIASSRRFRTSTTTWSTRSRAGCRRADRHPLPERPRQERGRRQALRASLRRRRDAVAVHVRRRRRPLPQPLRAHHALPGRARRRQAGDARLRAAAPGRSARERVPHARERREHQRPVPRGQPARALRGRPPMAARSGHARDDRRVRLRRRAEGPATRTPPIRHGTPRPASSSTSASSTGRARSCARTGSTARAGCITCRRSPSRSRR